MMDTTDIGTTRGAIATPGRPLEPSATSRRTMHPTIRPTLPSPAKWMTAAKVLRSKGMTVENDVRGGGEVVAGASVSQKRRPKVLPKAQRKADQPNERIDLASATTAMVDRGSVDLATVGRGAIIDAPRPLPVRKNRAKTSSTRMISTPTSWTWAPTRRKTAI
jgi:hypothetical protein